VAKKASAFVPPAEDEAELVTREAPVASAPADRPSLVAVHPEPAPEPAASTTPTVPQPPAEPKSLPSYRVGRRNLSAWIDAKAFNQFKAMVSEEGKTIQDYMVEMVNREFARKGRPQIAK
jgi:hypothetical protein